MKYRLTKNRPTPLNLPCKKTIYHSKEEAEDMIRHISEVRETKEIWAYRCTICGFWHLTSKERE